MKMKKQNKGPLARGMSRGELAPGAGPLANLAKDHELAVTSPQGRSSSEVVERARRRQFPGEYKQRILREASAATARGELGALLRREGLYSSHLTGWRAQAQSGELAGLKPKQRGPKAMVVDPRDKRIAELERENVRLGHRVERAEAIIEVQKKVSQLLGLALPITAEAM